MTGSWPSDQDASGRSFRGKERTYLERVLASGVLNSTRGTFVEALEKQAGRLVGAPAVACASGSAAVHTAIAALDLEPGSEVVTSPLTDFGGVAPILWQGCIPVFADVDPATLNMTADSVAERLTPRTAAVIVPHLFGNPADVREIVRVTDAAGVPLIEDCAQAYGATLDDRHVGSFGTLACFSLQQTKHITSGEGGLITVGDDALFRRVHQFVNKGRVYTDEIPEHHFLSMNYRMTELQGAVAAAQFARLSEVVEARRAAAIELSQRLAEVPEVRSVAEPTGARSSFWRYALCVEADRMADLAAELRRAGVPGVMPGYQRPAFEWRFIREQRTFGTSRYPFNLASPQALDYGSARFPGLLQGRAEILVLSWNERYGSREVEALASLIEKASR